MKMPTLNNPRTTIIGYLVIIGAATTFLLKLLNGEPVTIDEMISIFGGIGAGAVGIFSGDGGH